MKGLNLDYIKILYSIAWADKELQEEELNILSEVVFSLGLSDEETKKANEFQERVISFDDISKIDFEQFSHEQKMHIMLLAATLIKADGLITEDEKKFFYGLKKLLNFENIDIEDLISDIENSIDIFG